MAVGSITDVVLADAAYSFHVRLGPGGAVEKVEVWPIVALVWRGVERRVQTRCDRYLSSVWREADGTSSDELTDWRCYVYDVRPADGVGPAVKAALGEVAVPMVKRWLEGGSVVMGEGVELTAADAYALALFHAISREIGEGSYSTGRARRALELHGGELPAEWRARLAESIELLERSTALRGNPLEG